MASRDDGDKTDAGRGRFKVTEQLEAWSAEREGRKQRQAATHDRYATESRPRSAHDHDGATSRGVLEWLSPITLRPDDFAIEPTCFRLGIGFTESVFADPDLIEVAAVDPWPEFEVEWRMVGARSRRRFLPRFAEDRDGFAKSVDELFSAIERRLAPCVMPGWRAELLVTWEQVAAFPGEDEPEREARGGYRTSAKERPREEVIARRASSAGRETMLDWLASTPDYPFREHPREIVVSDAFVYVRRHDDRVYRVPLSTLRKMRANRDGDAVFIFGRNTTLLVPHRPNCEVARLLESRASSVDYLQPQR